MEEVYAKFLRSVDLAIWLDYLNRYRGEITVDGIGSRAALRLLSQGLCITKYANWLSERCGDEEAKKKVGDTFEYFAGIAAAFESDQSSDGIMVKALTAENRGYSARAKEILEALDSEIPLEVALLVMPGVAAKRAPALKSPIYARGIAKTFPPAVYFYAHDLLDLGYLQQVRKVVAEFESTGINPLAVDLKGKLAEMTGAWAEAYNLYKDSPWIVHRYRSLLCSVIVKAAAGNAVTDIQSAVDEQFGRAMLLGDSESTQADVTRSAMFVNACRWYNFDNWLVNYELGFLSFRRRRHAEAERHLNIAARQAPEKVQFAIKSLRFANLTWLSESRAGWSLPLKPETLECAHDALQAPVPEEEKAYIRTWIADDTKDVSGLAPVLRYGTLYERAKANLTSGNMPEALDCFSKAVAESFIPRAFHSLIIDFTLCGFEATTQYCIEVVMRESWDNFFQLWELGQVVIAVLANQNRLIDRSGIEDTLLQIEERVEQLAENEFQHLMRAWQLYTTYGRGDLASRVLQSAQHLAESPEENVILAVARRDKLGLEHLLRAERESTHRLERLDIACIFTEYGQMGLARRILRGEHVFDSDVSLKPVEYVIVLGCGNLCLTEKEISTLTRRAGENLERDLQAGLVAQYGDKFKERLSKRTGIRSEEEIARSVIGTSEKKTAADPDDSAWKSWVSSLDRLTDPILLDEAWRLIEKRMLKSGEESLITFFYIAAWKTVYTNLDSLLDRIKLIRPTRELADTPISKTYSFAVNKRAEVVSRHWREYLTKDNGRSAGEYLKRVEDFYREERRLEEEWKTLRNRDMLQELKKARYYVTHGLSVLDRIGHRIERHDLWPSFLAIRIHLERDIDTLREQLAGWSEASIGYDE